MKTNSIVKNTALKELKVKLSYLDRTLVQVLIFLLSMSFVFVVSAQNVTIPDANFKAALLADASINTLDDGEISVVEAEAFTGTMNIGSSEVVSLLGLEAFINLTVFYADNNNIVTGDFSSNTQLETISLNGNSDLNAVNVTGLTVLENLQVKNGMLTELDVSTNTALQTFEFYNNDISEIDISNNTDLRNVNFSLNDLTELDVSNNLELQRLNYWQNNVSTALDLSQHPDITTIQYLGNNISEVNLANGFNENITLINGGSNPATCIKVDDKAYSEANWSDKFDEEANFSDTYCDPNEWVEIPDANFKAALNAHSPVIDSNDDDEISYGEAEAFTGKIGVGGSNISDATGLEAFVNVTEIDFRSNQLSSIDLSNNTALTYVYLRDNDLLSLDISDLSLLTYVNIQSNDISSMDFSNNLLLETIYAYDNNLTTFDISLNTSLHTFWAGGNAFTSADVTNNSNLEYLWISTTALTSIDISNNLLLKSLILKSNALESLDVTNHTALTRLEVDDNDLTSLDLSNNPDLNFLQVQNNDLSSLDLRNGNNSILPNGNFNTTGNTSLTCIAVSDLAYANTTWTNIDEGTSFSVGCDSNEIIDIPDANFKAVLAANTGIDTTDDDEITVGEAIAYVGAIEATSASISDLTGLEYFINLTGLDVALNDISELDLSNNTALTAVRLGGNNLSSLDLSNNTDLFQLIITDNPIASIDLSNNSQLTYFTAGNNGFTSLDVTNNTALTNLSIYNQPGLTALDVSALLDLKVLTAFNNAIESIDLSNNTLLEQALLENNQLTAIDVSNNIELYSLNVGRNDLTELNLIANVDLVTLNFYRNEISSIDLSSNPLIQNLIIQETEISSLDLSILPDLKDFRASATSITNLDLSSNPDLTYFIMTSSSLESLDLRNGSNELITTIHLSSNSNLLCASVDNPAYAKTNWTNVDDADIFNIACDPNEIVNIPDANFKAALVAHNPVIDANSDGEIQVSEASAFAGTINANELGIIDATGIEYFDNLMVLYLKDNSLTSIDLTNNSDLVALFLTDNSISEIDVSNNVALQEFNIRNNGLNSIDLSNNPVLAKTEFEINNLSELDVSNNPELIELYLQSNDLTEIDLSNNPILTRLRIHHNDLTELDLSNNPNLRTLLINHNEMTTIDLSNNPLLNSFWATNCLFESVDFSSNPALNSVWMSNSSALTSVDISDNPNVSLLLLDNCSQLSTLDVRNGNNSILNTFNTTTTPNLTCISVDNPAFSVAAWTAIDVANNFSLGCDPNEIINIPDANFKAVLVADDLIDTDFDDEITVSEAEAFTGTINVNEMEITDLTGIEYFVNLTTLYAADNSLTEVNFSNNSSLTVLNVDSNELTSIDVSSSSGLLQLYVSNNLLTTVDVSSNPLITTCNVHNNDLTTLDVSAQTNLQWLSAHGNNFTSVELSNNVALTKLTLSESPLTSLDLSANILLEELSVSNCSLAALDVSNNTALKKLYALQNNLTSLDLTNNTLLTDVYIGDNDISALDLTYNTELVNLDVYSNSLTSIDFTNNVDLEFINLNSNDLTSLDISNLLDLDVVNACCMGIPSVDLSNNVALTEVWLQSNEITELDLSLCPLLNKVVLYNNDLISVNIANGENEGITDFRVQLNDELQCIMVDDPAYSDDQVSWQKDELANYSLDCNVVDIPDDNLRAYLLTQGGINDNGDEFIQVSEAESYTGGVNVKFLEVSDLTGIEAFVQLTSLGAQNNSITSVDLSQNTELTSLYINNNGLTELDLTSNSKLKQLQAHSNQLSSIDVSNLLALERLWVKDNLLTSLVTTNNTELTDIECGKNMIASLDLSTNIKLTTIQTHENNLTELDVSNNPELFRITAFYNDLTELDLSNNPLLTSLNVEYNSISEMDVSMLPVLVAFSGRNCDFTSLNLANGNNSNMNTPLLSVNPNLTCITVDDLAYAEANWTNLDDASNFSTNCNNVETDIIGLTLDEQSSAAIIDLNNHTVFVEVPFDTDLSGLTPVITVSDGAIINPASESSQDFTSDVVYTVTSENPSVYQDWTVTVSEENLAPTGLALSASSIDEENEIDDIIGVLSSTDPNTTDSHVYSLVSGTGDTDNASFSITGNELLASEIFDFETKETYSIRVQTDDGRGGIFETTLEISINDVVERIDQTIAFDEITGKTYGNASFAITASTSSELDIVFSVISGPISMEGNVVSIIGAGEAIIAADQAGDESFYAASQVTRSFTIAKADQQITITAIADKLTTDDPFDVEANTTSELELNYAVTGPALIEGTMITLEGTEGVATVTVSQLGNENYNAAEAMTSFEITAPVVELQDQTITFAEISDKIYGDASFEINATASSELTVLFSVVSGPVTLDGSLVTITGAGEVVIAADQAGSEAFNSATQVSRSFTISKANQTISVTPIDNKVTTDAAFEIDANTTSELILTYSVTGPATNEGATITLDGTAGLVTVTVTQSGDDNFNAAEVSTAFDVTVEDEVTAIATGGLQISFFPNPATDFLSIEGLYQQIGHAEIIDLKGVRVLDQEVRSGEQLLVKDLNTGIYILRITDNIRTTTTRLIIRR